MIVVDSCGWLEFYTDGPLTESIAGDLYGKFKDLNCLEELSIERAKEIEKEMIWQFSKKFQGEWS